MKMFGRNHDDIFFFLFLKPFSDFRDLKRPLNNKPRLLFLIQRSIEGQQPSPANQNIYSCPGSASADRLFLPSVSLGLLGLSPTSVAVLTCMNTKKINK